MKTKIIALLLTLVVVFTITGCAKCVSTEYKNVDVMVVDEYYRGVWMQPIFNGKATTYITHPAVWHITVEYNGVEYTIGGHDTYEKYADRIGETAIGVLEVKTFDDGMVMYDIVALG